ncbi:MAG: type II secretion system F family protein [Calditrichaeota bacterium]|nr:MAG: type II secretion system F family protein [Calditrichota bacterium]
MSTNNITIRPGKQLKKKHGRKTPVTKQGQPRVNSAKQSSFKDFFTLDLSGGSSKKSINKKVKLEELHTFANQLSVLLSSGVPLLASLNILADQTQNQQFKSVIITIVENINNGHTFHEGLSEFPKVFPNIFISLVKAAEMSGGLPEVLKQVASYLREQDKTQKRIKSATAYPRFVFYFFLVILVAVIYGLVPKFQETFESYNAELPMITEYLLAASNAALRYIYFEIGVLVIGIMAYKNFLKTPKGRYFESYLRLKIPVMGDIIMKDIISRFCRTLYVLIKSGVPLVNALEVSSETAQNVLYAQALRNIKQGIISGDTFSRQLAFYPVFPSMVVKMIATGEQSGALDTMLKNISDLYDADVESKIAGISSVIEPVLMVGLGIIAIFVILALYLPIFKMGSIM